MGRTVVDTLSESIAVVNVAIGLGAFTIARRTLDTVGSSLVFRLPVAV